MMNNRKIIENIVDGFLNNKMSEFPRPIAENLKEYLKSEGIKVSPEEFNYILIEIRSKV